MAENSQIRELPRSKTPEPAERKAVPARPAVAPGARRRGILDDFLARSALLVIVYAAINVVYQQSYLNYLGFRVGLWPIATALPLLTDFLVAFYAFMMWVFLTRLPDRWFDTVAELFNLGTWQDRETWMVRTVSLLFPYFVFYVVSIYDNITRQGFIPPPHRQRLFPTQELFSQTVALVAFGLLCLAFAVGVGYYRYIRSLGIRQATPAHRLRARLFLNGMLPGGLVMLMATVFLIFPSWYGRQRAQVDVRRLARENLQVVSNLALDGDPVCRMSESLSGPSLPPTTQSSEWRVHFLGRLQDLYLLLVVQAQPRGSDLTDGVPDFYSCLISTSSLRGIELSAPDSY